MPAAPVAAFLGLMEPEPDHVLAYQDWHADDHQPENQALDGVVYANRWLASDEHVAARQAPDAELAAARFAIAYLFAAPLEASLDEWEALERSLREQDRMFAHRALRLGGLFDLAGGEVAPRAAVSLRALPFRRHRGVLLHLAEGKAFGADDDARFHGALESPHVAGGLRFTSSGVREYGASRAGRAELYFADGDPLAAFAGFAPAGDALFAGPFRTTADLAPGALT